MAKSTTPKGQKPIPISSNTAVEEPPDEPIPPEEAEIPAATLPKADTPKTPSFFQTMARIPKDDWGPRASIYLYRLEPVIDRLRGGDKKYIMMYTEPINEERIMVDQGSGRYKAVLTFQKPGAERGNEIDATFFDILNLKFPPKVPKGEWVDDPRNKKWAWAKEPDPPTQAPASGLAEFTGVLRAANELRKEIRDEMKPEQPAQATQAASPIDPWAAAEKILNMRSDNPMMDFVKEEMKAMRVEMAAGRDREFQLHKELREKAATVQPAPQPAPAAEKPKTLLEQATELAEAAGKLKSIFGAGESIGGTVVRAAKMGTLEFFAEIIPKIAESPILNAVAAKMMMPSPTNGAPGVVLPNLPHSQPAQPANEAEFLQFMKYAISPALMEYLESGEPGDEFAAWVHNAYPDKLPALQNFHHPMIPGLPGPAAIIAAYRSSPMWPRIVVHGEAAFTTFVQQFCDWKPEGAATEAPPAPGEPIDIDTEMEANV